MWSYFGILTRPNAHTMSRTYCNVYNWDLYKKYIFLSISGLYLKMTIFTNTMEHFAINLCVLAFSSSIPKGYRHHN